MPVSGSKPPVPREILFEIRQSGAYMRVAAIDAETDGHGVHVRGRSTNMKALDALGRASH